MSLENAHSAIQNISHEFAAFLAKVSPDLDALRREEGWPLATDTVAEQLRQAFSDELENLFSETFGRVRDRLDGRSLMDRAA
jgi:hypothetical protein